jgi:hypothetical protein
MLAGHPQARPVRVVEQHRSGYVVADGPETGFRVESMPEWPRPRFPPEQRPAVGDWVLIEGGAPNPDPPERSIPKPKIVALLPRRSAIKRGAAGEHYKQQLIAANIDTVFVVCGLDADFNPRRIERYLRCARRRRRAGVVRLAADLLRSWCGIAGAVRRSGTRRRFRGARGQRHDAASVAKLPVAAAAAAWCWSAVPAPASRRSPTACSAPSA